MAKMLCLLFILQSLWLSAFSATIQSPENTSQGSDFPKLTLSNWIEDNATYLPADAGNQSYFIGYVPARGPADESQAHFRPFSIQAFRDNPKLKELSLDFKLWFHHDSEVVDSKFQPIVTEKAKFSPKTLTGSAEYFKDYVFRSFRDISYAFQDLKAKYFGEHSYDGKLPGNLAVLQQFPLTYMRCFTLLPLNFSDAEAKNALSKTKLKLFIRLGNLGSEGLIYLTDWTISERQEVCPHDYFLLDVANSRLHVAGEPDQLDRLRKVTQPMQALISRDDNKDLPIIQIPHHRIRKESWYFYNPKYDTIYQNHPKDVIPEVSICDIAGNCFHYGDPIDGKYVLDEQTKKFLGNTPFVRYIFEEDKSFLGRFDGHLSDRQGKQWKGIDEMKSQFAGSVKAAGSFTKGVQRMITIPMTKIDVRMMYAKYALKCTKPVKIVSVDLGRNKMDLSALPETTTPSFWTEDYFVANPTDVRDLEDVVLTLTTSADQAECQVDERETMFQIVELTTFDEAVNHDGSLKVKDNIVRFDSKWIKYADNINFRSNDIKAEFEIESKHRLTEAMKQKVRVRRMIFGKDYYGSYTGDYQTKGGPTIDFDKDGHKFKIVEDVQTLPQMPIGSAVRIEYIIQLPDFFPDDDTKDKEGTENEYECKAKIHMKASKEGERKCLDNSILYQHCQYETSKCPSSFSIDIEKCKMVTQYIAHVEECEPTSCSNFLAKPIHKMDTVTKAQPEVRRFYPLSSLAQNNETYLRVSFEPRPNYDSCVYFHYYGSTNKLLLEFDGTDSQLTLNYRTDPGSELEVEACSSQYTRHPDKVNGFTFMFTGSESQFESNIGDHFVELVKFDFNKRLENNDNFV